MTSTKSPNPPIKKDITYPCLMEYVDKDFVIMFFSPTEGVAVWSEYDVYPVGHYSDAWNNIKDSCWIPFEGTITLQN